MKLAEKPPGETGVRTRVCMRARVHVRELQPPWDVQGRLCICKAGSYPAHRRGVGMCGAEHPRHAPETRS